MIVTSEAQNLPGRATYIELPRLQGALFPLKPHTIGTLVGAIAIPLWATWPLLAALSTSMPLFQFLTLIFAVGAVVLSALSRSLSPDTTKPEPTRRSLAVAWTPALMVALGLLGSDVLFI